MIAICYPGSNSLIASLLFLQTRHQLSDTELINHLADVCVVNVNVVQLDLWFLRDKVHASFSFLVNYLGDANLTSSWSLSEMPLTGPFWILCIRWEVYPESVAKALLTSNFVPKFLGLDDGDVVDDSLVGVEICGKSSVRWLGKLTFRSTSQWLILQLF